MSVETLTFPEMRSALNRLSDHAGEWAGLPMPITDETLIVHPSYPYAKVFEKPDRPDDVEILHRFPARRLKSEVIIFRDPDTGKKTWGLLPWTLPADMQLHTLGIAGSAYDFAAEIKAMEKLQSLLPKHAFTTYLMCGAFLESSKRSGVIYLFRRLRPTLALSASTGEMQFLCALCLHPIGYYQDTWAGAMVPTDEVIAHLMLMRGDEHAFWKQANQHPGWRPEAGL